MSYVTVPCTFTSASTILAANMNSNFTALVDSLKDGTKSLNVYKIDCATMTVSSTVSVTNTAIVTNTFSVGTTATFSSIISSSSTKMDTLNLTPENITITDSSIKPTKTYAKLTGTTLNSIDGSNFIDGSILILSKSTVSSSITISSGALLVLGAATRTLDHVSDKIILQYVSGIWYELQFQSNA